MKKTLVAYPYVLWAIIFIVVPMFLVAYYGFTTTTDSGEAVFSIDNFVRFFTTPVFLKACWKSIWMAALSTVICLVLGYPVAYIMSGNTFKNKGFLLLLLIVPMWMNLLLRTYAWIILLDNKGIFNTILSALGLGTFEFMYHDYSIIFGMVYNFLPFMILPIHSVLSRMDRSLVEAAQDLGADKKKVFMKVTLPLSIPGVISGITMVFMPAISTFAISDILSGRTTQLIGNLIEEQFLRSYNWNMGSAMSLILIVIILISMLFTSKSDREDEGGGLF